MERLIHFVLSQRFFVFLLTAVLITGGIAAWQRLPIDAFPDVTNVQVMVLSKAEGLSSLDVEQRVTFPIEQKMGGLPRVKQVRSLSKSGLSQVVVIFEDGTDIYFARQVILERLQEAREELPPGTEPEMAPISTGLGEIFQYTLESASATLMDLRTLQDWVVSPQLRPISGVTEVNSFGGFAKQYQVLVDPDRLQKYGLTLNEITEAISRNNANAAGNFLVRGWEQENLRSVGLLTGPTDLENIILRAGGGTAVRVRDVAEVQIGSAIRHGAVTRDGRGEAVAGMVIMLKDENSRLVVDRVKAKIPQIQMTLPQGVDLKVFYDRTSLVEACIETVTHAMRDGGLWVILILFLFLAELRTGLIVVCSIPITFLISFIVMRMLGMSSNLMSLGGLAFSVGMVGDASVVVIENARRHLAEAAPDEPRLPIMAKAIGEVARPTFFSQLIIAIVMLPLFTLEGMEGKMFIPLALTMMVSLLVSIGVAFFIIPALGESLLPRGKEHTFFFIKAFNRLYGFLVYASLRFPAIVILVVGLTVALAVHLGGSIGSEFMPPLEEGAIAINAVRLPNASLDGAVAVATQIEKLLQAIPEVKAVVCKTGRAEISEDPMGPEQTDIIIPLVTSQEMPSRRSQAEVVEAVAEVLNGVPGLRYSFSQPIALRVNELISGIKSDVAVKVFGDDLETLAGISKEVTEVLGQVPGAKDVKSAQVSGMTQLDLEVDRPAAARLGLNVADINELIETAVGGRLATVMIEGQRRFDVVVRYPPAMRGDAAAIGRLKVVTPDGVRVPLEQFTRVRQVEVPIEIARENGLRRMVVEANIRGRDLGGFIEELRRSLAPVVEKLPRGYFIEFGGQFENQQRAMARLEIVVPLALLLIFVLLVMAMGYLRDAVLVMLNLPFSLVGGVLGLWWYGLTFSVSAAIAFIVLLGIAVQNGVLLVAFFRQLLTAGQPLDSAVRHGCALRFRPLMMTGLSTFISHVPMLISSGAGADLQRPLAVVVNFGLVSSMLLTMLVLPVLFRWTERWLGDPEKNEAKET